MLSIAITLLVLGLLGASILRRHLREAKLVRLREIAHRERMMALERGAPLPDTDVQRIESLLGDGAATDSDRPCAPSSHWVRLAALALGLVCVFGGAGSLPGFYYLSDAEASGMWPIGLIPLFIGAGLLIFVRLSRGLAEKMEGTQGSP